MKSLLYCNTFKLITKPRGIRLWPHKTVKKYFVYTFYNQCSFRFISLSGLCDNGFLNNILSWCLRYCSSKVCPLFFLFEFRRIIQFRRTLQKILIEILLPFQRYLCQLNRCSALFGIDFIVFLHSCWTFEIP